MVSVLVWHISDGGWQMTHGAHVPHQALSNAGAAANSGDLLTTLGSTAQAFQV